jgi:hypothetical protein
MTKKCYQIALAGAFPPQFFLAPAQLWYGRPMQSSSPKSYPFHVYGTRDRRTAFGVTDFLRANDRLASLMPTALRIGNLQKDVKVILPPMYAGCEVLSLQEGSLTLSAPSSAVAAKLKQQLPKLQTGLQKKGWQVEAVRIKIQVGRALAQQAQADRKAGGALAMPATAVDAFEELGETLEDSPQNAQLIAAVKRLAEKRKRGD